MGFNKELKELLIELMNMTKDGPSASQHLNDMVIVVQLLLNYSYFCELEISYVRSMP